MRGRQIRDSPSHPFSPSPQPRGRKEKGWLSLNKIGGKTEKREGLRLKKRGVGWPVAERERECRKWK